MATVKGCALGWAGDRVKRAKRSDLTPWQWDIWLEDTSGPEGWEGWCFWNPKYRGHITFPFLFWCSPSYISKDGINSLAKCHAMTIWTPMSVRKELCHYKSFSFPSLFFPKLYGFTHSCLKMQSCGVQLTRWLCIDNLSSLLSSLMIISSQKYHTRLSFLHQTCFPPQREKVLHRKYYKVAATITVGSLLSNTGFEGLVAETLVLGHTCCHWPDACVAQLQWVCCILASSLSLTWPVRLVPEAVVWNSSSELPDGAGMKPKLEMLRRLSGLPAGNEGQRRPDAFSIFLENKFLCEKRERFQRRTWRGTPLMRLKGNLHSSHMQAACSGGHRNKEPGV